MTRSKRDAAVDRLAQLEAEARRLRVFIEMYDALPDDDVESADRPSERAENKPPSQQTESEFSSNEEIIAAVRNILDGETQPMHINFLYKLVTQRGIRVSGRNPKGNLSAKLAPYKDIVYIRDRGWIIKGPEQNNGTPLSEKLNGAPKVTGEAPTSSVESRSSYRLHG